MGRVHPVKHATLVAAGTFAVSALALTGLAATRADAQAARPGSCSIITAKAWATLDFDKELGDHLARERVKEEAKKLKAKTYKVLKVDCQLQLVITACTAEARICK